MKERRRKVEVKGRNFVRVKESVFGGDARGAGLSGGGSLVGCCCCCWGMRHGRRRLQVDGRPADDAERPVLGVEQVGEVLAAPRHVELSCGPVAHHQAVEVVQADVAAALDEQAQQAPRAAVAGRVHRRAALRDTADPRGP